MITIRISGIIASWQLENEENVTPQTLRKSLDSAGSENLLITINSPGGSVFQGLEMFSMIRNYPGHVEMRVVSLAASMGSILSLAGNKKSIENTAVFFIHNAQGIGFGDYREMFKAAKWLEDVTELLAELYEKHTTLDLKKARELMDADTQFFGSDLVDLGFELVDTGEIVNQAVARVQATARLKECEAKISSEEVLNDLEKVAASIAEKKKPKPQNNITPVANAGKNKEKENTSVKNLEELKAQHPDIFAGAVEFGKTQAMDLVNAHLTLGEACGSIELAVKNIKAGNQLTQTVNAEYQAKGMKTKDVTARLDDDKITAGTGEGGLDEEVNEADTKELADDISKGIRGKKKNE